MWHEQAHGGSRAMKKKSFLPRAIHKYASPTFWMLLHVANDVLRKKKNVVALAWKMCNRGHPSE